MPDSLKRLGGWLHRRAENIIAFLLATMFVAFVIQVVFRYLLNFPIGWTTELTLISWLWLVLFGAGFVLSEREEIRFDLIHGAMGKRTRRVTTIITHTFLIGLYVFSFPAIMDYVLFMKVQKTSYLDIPFDVLYFIYPIFAAATIARYGWLLLRAIRGWTPPAADLSQMSSGL